MGRTVNEVIDALPAHRRRRVHARYRELKDDLESLSELRKAVGKAQGDIAAGLKIRQPSVAKIEKQTDMYLSSLRSHVEALGGKLELVVSLPAHRAIRLHQLGEESGSSVKHAPRSGVRRSASARKSSKHLARTG
jgi:hypothetical protein